MDEGKPPEDNKEPIVPEVVNPPAVVEPVPEVNEPRGALKLENLPDNIKRDLHELIAKGYKGWRCKKIIEDRWLGKTTFLPAAQDSFEAYIKRYGEEILTQKNLQKSLMEATKESLDDTKSAIESIGDEEMDLEDKKKIFTQLFAKCSKRIKIIESYNAMSGFINPQIESVLNGYLKEQRGILETLIKLQGELNKENENRTYQEIESLFYMCFVPIINVYKELHGEEKLLEYQSKVQEAVRVTLQAYKDNKANPEK